MTCEHCGAEATRERDGASYCEAHYWASFFLYVPSGGRKMPLRGWSWSSKCPEGIDPRSEDNPYVFTYEQTLGEAREEISGRVPDWDDTWIRVGVVDGYEWVDVDIDLDDHDETLDDPDAIGISDSSAGVMRTSGGFHIEVLVEETVESFTAKRVPGIDYQGTVKPVGLGVAGDPFHGSDGYEFKNAGEPVSDLYEIVDGAGVVSYQEEALFRRLRQDESRGEGYEREDVDCDHPVSAEQVVPRFSAGEQGSHPIHGSSTGANFRVDEGGDTWACWSGRHDHQLPPDKHNVTGNAYHYVAMEEDILECGEWMASDEPYAGKQDEIAEACRRRGIPLPLHLDQGEQRPGIIAPNTPITRADPEHDPTPDITLEQVRRETRNFVREAIDLGGDVVLSPEPAAGKSYASLKELPAQGRPAVYATNTHRNINEACEWMDEEGFTDFDVPPSAGRTGVSQDGDDLEHLEDTHCPTYCGDHGEVEKDRMRDLVDACDGSTRKAHALAESDNGKFERFPCQEGDGDCNYMESWDRWDADATVQVCHYSHLNMRGIMTVGDGRGQPRTVVIDEFPGASFETSWTGRDDDNRSISQLRDNVRDWLAQFQPRPTASGEDVWDALERQVERSDNLDGLREANTLEDLRDVYVPWEVVDQRDIEGAVDNGWHPATGLVAYLYAKSTRLGNDWRAARAGKYSLAVEPNGDIHLVRPPELSEARQVVGLDATACEPMWQAALGKDELAVADTMSLKEKRAYYKKALNIDVVQVSDWMKSMAGVGNPGNDAFRADHARVVIDYLAHVAQDEETGLITSKGALDAMRGEGVGMERVDRTGYYGNFKGENRFGEVNVGAVFGSNHPGDRVIEKWAAYRGESAERNERPEGDQSDWELSYQNEVGDAVFDYFLEGAVKQAVVRFSRGEERGLVVVYTDRLPDEIPRYKAGLTAYADSRHDVLEAIESGATTLEEASERVHWSERTVRRAVDELEDAGAVSRTQDGKLRAHGPVSRVGRIGDDGCPILEYRGSVADDSEDLPADPQDGALLGVRALLMEIVDDEPASDGSVQAGLMATDGGVGAAD